MDAKIREHGPILLGRLLAGGMFFNAGASNLAKLDAQAGYAASKGLPEARTLVALASLLLLFGGFSLLTGFLPRLGVLALVAFLVPVNIVMHAFWGLPAGVQRQSEMYHFLANVGLTGSTLMFLAIPRPWAYSFDPKPAAIARLLQRLTGRVAIDIARR
jgi:uncharacterized membrane protein YphA (DoxX/SURF4 family)